MKTSNRSNQSFVKIVAEHCTRLAVIGLTRSYRFRPHTFRRWRAKYGTMDVSKTQRLGVLEAENRQLRLALSCLTLDYMALKDAILDKPINETKI